MPKLYAERLKKPGADQAPTDFPLQFKSDEAFLRPHFKALLVPQPSDRVTLDIKHVREGIFTVEKDMGDQGLMGTFQESTITTDPDLERIDYEVDFQQEEQTAEENKGEDSKQNDVKILTVADLIDKSQKLDGGYPGAKTIRTTTPHGKELLFKPGILKFEVADWGGTTNKERISWIVYRDNDYTKPVKFIRHGGSPVDIDMSGLPEGKYRVEAFGKYSQWHAKEKKDQFDAAISNPSKSAAKLDIVLSNNKLTDIVSSDSGPYLAPGENITFTTSDLFKEKDAMQGLFWTLTDANGNDASENITNASVSGNSITMNFPKPAGNKVQEYTLKATTPNGLTTERKFNVNFMQRLTEADLVDASVPQDKRTRTGAKSIAISAGPHNGSKVGLRPVTFRVSSPNKDAKFSWIVYQGSKADYPVRIEFDYGREYTVDFGQLPEGQYTVEAFGKISEWHAKNGQDRFGETLKSNKGPFAQKTVTSVPNALESVSSTNLVQGEKVSRKETNWGVPATFDASLLFDYKEDISQLTWEIKDKQGVPVIEDQTVRASGNAHPVFTFSQPAQDTDYTLTLRMGALKKELQFTVVKQATVKNISLASDADRFVYNQQKQLNFKVSGYSQQQANEEDLKKIKWVRVFFPNLHYEDYKGEQLAYTIKSGTISSVGFGTHSTTDFKVFDGKRDSLTIAAGIPETTAVDSPYKKGLYFIEAYIDRPEGKRGAMDVYEIARNEPTAISQYKMYSLSQISAIPGMAFVRPGSESFGFKVENWQFKEPLGEEKNVSWKLYSADGTKLIKTFSDKGYIVTLSFGNLSIPDGESRDYILKAYTGDPARGASIQVRAANPKIMRMFFADSTGRLIKRCGVGDTVYMYVKTIGLEYENLQVNVFEKDYLTGDDLMQGKKYIANERGVIFQPIELSKNLLETKGGDEEPFDLYMTLSFSNPPFKLTNDEFDRSQIHYRENSDVLLQVTYKKETTDFGFFDENWQPLKGPVTYGTKVKVRIRGTNISGKKFNMYLYPAPYGLKAMSLPESNQQLTPTAEGYVEMEFTIPKEWESSHPGADDESRFFRPVAIPTDKSGNLSPDFNMKKMLKVVKTIPVIANAKNAGDDTEYGDLKVEVQKSTDPFDALSFPLREKPLNAEGEVYGKLRRLFGNAESNWTKYGANRDEGHRKHGGIDMYTPALTPVYPITTGKVLYAGEFYLGTWEVTIEHDIEIVPGHKLIVRYGEMDPKSVQVSTGDTVDTKTMLGKTGYLEKKGAPLVVLDGKAVYMLHLEMYTGESGNDLSKSPLTDKSNGKYQRRNDLMDPENLLIRMYNNQFTNSDGSKTYFNEEDAKVGLRYILDNYGRDYAIGIERIYRAETTHFSSDQYLLCGTPGMEAVKGSTEPYYGWSADIFSKHPDSVAVGTVEMMEGKGLSDQGGIQQNTTDAKRFIKMKSVIGAMVVVAERIKKANGNFGAWYSNDADMRIKYNEGIEKIVPRIVNEMK